MKLAKVLKVLSCTAIFFVAYPFINLITVFAKNDPYMSIYVTLFMGLFGLFGYFTRGIFSKLEDKNNGLAKSLFIVLALVPAAITYVLNQILLKRPLWETILFIIFALVVYVLGYGFYYNTSDTFLNKKSFLAIIIINVVSIAILFITKQEFNANLYVLFFAYITVVFAFTKNQSGMDDMIERRKYNAQSLPDKIRLYNVKLISIIAAFMAVGFLFNKQITAGILYIVSAFKNVFGVIIRAIFTFLFGSTGGGDIEAPSDVGSDSLIVPVDPGKAKNGLFLQLFLIIIIGLAIFIIVFYRKYIGEYFAKIFRSIAMFFNKLFSFFGKKGPTQGGELGYFDVEEFVNSLDNEPPVLTVPQQIKKWKKNYSIYKKMDDSMEKYRFGYGLAIDGFKICGMDVLKSDTPNEITSKLNKATENDLYQAATKFYNFIRYGEGNYDAGKVAELEEALTLISEKKLVLNP